MEKELSSRVRRSTYDFPKEVPTDSDWELWVSYLRSMTGENFELATPLGAWVNVTHRSWEWVLSDGGDKLFQKEAKG